MTALDVKSLATDMKLDGEDKKPIDIYSILGSAISMAQLGTAANPAASAQLTMVGGFVTIMGAVNKS